MTLTTAILYGLFVGLVCYILGVYRGWKTYEHPCPHEDLDAYYNAGYEAGARAALKSKNGERFLEALDEVFRDVDDPENDDDDDENKKVIIDCGEY